MCLEGCMSFSGQVSACKPSASTILAYCMRCTRFAESLLCGGYTHVIRWCGRGSCCGSKNSERGVMSSSRSNDKRKCRMFQL